MRVSLDLHFKDSGLFSCSKLINDANFKKEGIIFVIQAARDGIS